MNIDYEKIFKDSPVPYALLKVILDDSNLPVDCLFIDTNHAFEDLVVCNGSVVGKSFGDIQGDIFTEKENFLSVCKNVITTKSKGSVEYNASKRGKFYRVEVLPHGDSILCLSFVDITEEKNFLTKIHQYVDLAPAAIFIADREGNYIFANKAACELLKYSREDLLRKRIPDVTAPEFADDAIRSFENLKTCGKDRREIALLRSDNSRVWILLDAVALPDGTFMAFCKDITAQKLAEEKLSSFENFNKTLLDLLPVPVFYKDSSLLYLGVNRAFEDFYGMDENYFKGKSVFDIHPEDKAIIYNKMDEELLRNGGRQVYETVMIDYASKEHHVILYKTLFKDSKGAPSGIIGVLYDITERKNRERELELYFTAIQSVDQPVLLTDANGNIIKVNRAFIKMYGFELDELIGKNPRVLNPGFEVYSNFGYTKEAYDKIFKGMWAAIKNPSVGTWHGTVINKKKDGSFLWVKLIINAIYDSRGNPESFIGLPVDITTTIKKEYKSKVELYQTIAALAELRDNETGNHMRRVGLLARILANKLGMPEKYCEDIEVFAPLHDIGKVGISDSILLAERKLTPEEFEIMKSHTILGYNIVKGKREMDMVAAITLSHHEWYNGKGYPQGLRGKDIPLSARITTVVDVYDALRSKRPYKEPWSHEDAVKYILSRSGEQFDPEIIEAFESELNRFAIIFNELKD
jgi:PAS domain S-box-containing protein